jgi:hypothetical protein
VIHRSHGGACFTAKGWSSVALRATAGGGALSRALDEPFAVKKMPACERWLNNEVDRATPTMARMHRAFEQSAIAWYDIATAGECFAIALAKRRSNLD